jgi:hypothetical protein
MKILKIFRKPHYSTFMLAVFLFTSCSSNEILENQLIQNKFTSKTLMKGSKISQEIFSTLKNGRTLETNLDDIFNFDSISEVQNTETGEVAYMIDSHDNVKKKLGAYIVDNGGYEFLIVEFKTDSDIKEILYKDVNGRLMLTVYANTITEEITTERALTRNTEDPDFADKVLDCLEDAYTNHGWASVGLWILTGFYPAVGVGAAIGCATRDCL